MSRSSESSAGPAVGVIGSRAVPHSGHVPGPSCTIWGSIGQVYVVPGGAGVAGAAPWPQQASAAGGPARYFAGSARNFATQCVEQKWYVVPACATEPAARAGSTVMPHTGSITPAGSGSGSRFREKVRPSAMGVPRDAPLYAARGGTPPQAASGRIVTVRPASPLAGAARRHIITHRQHGVPHQFPRRGHPRRAETDTNADARDPGRAPVEELRPRPGRERRVVRGPARRAGRLPRPQRRREVHDDAHPHHLPPRVQRLRPRRRVRRDVPVDGGPRAHRLPARERAAVPRDARQRVPATGRASRAFPASRPARPPRRPHGPAASRPAASSAPSRRGTASASGWPTPCSPPRPCSSSTNRPAASTPSRFSRPSRPSRTSAAGTRCCSRRTSCPRSRRCASGWSSSTRGR